MERSSRLVEIFNYLQDPHLVARFQKFCGVRGTFSRTVSGSAPSSSGGGSKEADRTHSHNNGACHHPITGGNESESAAVIGADEGEFKETAAAGARRRKQGEEKENLPQNGAVVTAANAGGDALGEGSNGPTEPAEKGGEVPVSSTLKPLRKNSLTGDAGQEFLIENRFLFYLFTFGTELGNELFYITFFPFVMWNMDAFVARRLIMVWVWVMYLGQCTKDVIGWSRPASPPVVKVEMFYNSEYSMPSTHAMSGTAIPFSLFFMTYGRWEVRERTLTLCHRCSDIWLSAGAENEKLTGAASFSRGGSRESSSFTPACVYTLRNTRNWWKSKENCIQRAAHAADPSPPHRGCATANRYYNPRYYIIVID